MKTICFVTSNSGKAKEVSEFLKKFNINVEHVQMEYDEPSDFTVEEVAKHGAKIIAEKLGKEDEDFRYETLNAFLDEIREIKNSKYKIRNGLIVGLNPSYQSTKLS